MCDVEAKLVAWLDGELSPEEAAGVGRHIKGCKECHTCLAAYEHVSRNFDLYCDALAEAKTRRHVPRWVPVLASAVVAAAVLFLVFPQRRVDPPPVFTPSLMSASVPAPTLQPAEAAAPNTIHRRRPGPSVAQPASKWQPTETAIQIAIPADAMFPPGVMPEGMNFVAEMSISTDGSVRQVRLRQ